MKSKKLNILCGAVFVFLVLAAIGLIHRFSYVATMLPDQYLHPVRFGLGILIVLAVVLGLGMLPRLGAKELSRGSRVVSVILALILGIICLSGAIFLHKGGQTLAAITAAREHQTIVSVFVRRDDPAQVMEDAETYRFAYSDFFDGANTERGIALLRESYPGIAAPEHCETMTALADALLTGEVDAIVMNPSYVEVLEDLPEYEGFSEQTKILYDQVVETDGARPAASSAEGAFLLYISGSDTRDDTLSTSRSDVNILATVNPETKQVLLVNTPRDYYIPNPESKDGALDKLTHCGIYGLDNSAEALSQLYKYPVDYYAQINFTGFETLIDAIGGITVDSDETFDAEGYHFTQGENTMDGKEALAFARERYAFTDGDNQRGRNQMAVIRGIIDRISSAETFVEHYGDILESLEGMFQTSLPQEKIAELVRAQLTDRGPWSVRSYAVTGTGDFQPTYSAPSDEVYVTWPDEASVARGQALIQKVLVGERLTESDLTAQE